MPSEAGFDLITHPYMVKYESTTHTSGGSRHQRLTLFAKGCVCSWKNKRESVSNGCYMVLW